MKNQFLLFLLLLFFCSTHGQKKYTFDYAIQYNFQVNDSSKVQTQLFLTNSKDNSYLLKVSEKDSLNFTLYFQDQNGITSTTYLSKKEFASAKTITLKCEFVSHFSNPFKYQTENYDFINQKDTLINTVYHSNYILKSNKPKKEKRKKFATLHFIIEGNTGFHLPILTFSTAYEEWKKERNIPNGIPKQSYTTKYLTKDKILIYDLVEYIKINKILVVPKECNYLAIDLGIIKTSHK